MTQTQTAGNGAAAPAGKVLVVDDEESITDLVATTLRYEGFDVAIASAGREAISLVQSYQPDIVILDVMLGDIDGFDVIRRLRGGGQNVPVLFLSAAGAPEDRVRGLTLGGDDYLCKPFSLAELVARVRVVLRRHAPVQQQMAARLTVADLEMNLDTLQVTRGQRSIELTPTEFKLLRYLMDNANRVLSKDQIVDHVWSYDFNGDASIVETYVSYLRRKVDSDGPRLIHTVRGFGYSIRPPRP
jgi:two-component system OmpR family response regulator